MELDEKNNDLDAMLHFKRTLNDVNKSERPADALAVKKVNHPLTQSLTA